MTPILCLLLGPALAGQAGPKPPPARYLKREGERFVLECEVTTTATPDGPAYVSRTVRGTETMTLTVQRDRAGRVVRADLVHKRGEQSRAASLEVGGERAKIKRGGTTDFVKLPDNPVVTTAPDWSDVFELVRRHDAKKAGKQEFPGLWFHPAQPHLLLTFSVEMVGADTVKVRNEEQRLDRYQVGLRSGAYRVWAREGRVVKILPAGAKAVAVVLEGYEEATQGLK